MRALASLLLLAAVGCGGGEAAFVDVAANAGLDFRHHSGAQGDYLLPEIMSGGAGFLDYDGDGFLDVYLVQVAAGGNRLYRNDGQGGFRDVTDETGTGDAGYGMGCAAGDYDNDGDVDLYVTNLGANVLYRNEASGRFTDVSLEAGVAGPGWSTSAAFLDFDADGDLDLFVTDYVAWEATPAFVDKTCYAVDGTPDYCSPQAYAAPTFDTLYRNDGDGRFTDVSAEAGIRAKAGTGLGVGAGDLDGDGRLDIYVANDQMPSFAWINRGGGRFEERAIPLGIAVDETGKSQAGMGVVLADVDDDGALDIWKVHLDRESHILYLNRGHYFDDATLRFGLAAPTRPYTGFGTALFDHDLDGLLDAFVANGRVQQPRGAAGTGDVYAEPNQLLRQAPAGRFHDVGADLGPAMALVDNSRAAAFGDYDNDGDIDLLIANRDGPVRLLRNDVERLGGFLTLRLLDPHGRDAYGARLTVRVDGRERTFQVDVAYSYCATNDPRVHVGLGRAETVERIDVLWPDGGRTTHGPFEANRFVTLRR
jgi:hypothetical protein